MTDSIIVSGGDAEVIEIPVQGDSLISLDDAASVVTVGDTVTLLIDSTPDIISITPETLINVDVVTVSEQGPVGPSGSAGGAGVFITDVQAIGGNIGNKVYTAGTVPANATIESCVSDTSQVRVFVAANGNADFYSPTVTVNGQPVVMGETGTKRWFAGSVVLTIGAGTTTLRAESGTVQATATVDRAGAGPDVLDVAFGSFPNGQIALKAGDQLGVTVFPAAGAVSVTLTGPAASLTLPVVSGAATGFLTMDGSTGTQTFSVVAKNAIGTPGAAFQSPALTMDQTYPTLGAISINYPVGQVGLNTGQTAAVTCVATNADAVAYTGTGLVIAAPGTYNATKTVGHNLIGYNSPLYIVTAYRLNNGAQTTSGAALRVATVAPTAAISITPTGRLVGSPAGTDYVVRITPDQQLLNAPSMNASHGVWQGSGWAALGSLWTRTLRVFDATARGTGTFSALSMIGPSGIVGTTISAGSTYTVGGFSLRTLTFAAFARVAAIGAQVGIAAKLSAQIVGGNVLNLRTDNAVVQTGFYPANADGSYNATGAYIGLSDTALAGSNTSGTLQISVSEAA